MRYESTEKRVAERFRGDTTLLNAINNYLGNGSNTKSEGKGEGRESEVATKNSLEFDTISDATKRLNTKIVKIVNFRSPHNFKAQAARLANGMQLETNEDGVWVKLHTATAINALSF